MSTQPGGAEHGSPVPGDLLRSLTIGPARDLAAAVEGLNRATENFVRRLGEIRPPDSEPEGGSAHPAARFDMATAERDARRYLELAKVRIDRLIGAAIAAAERESDEIRREAEAQVESRWHQIEIEAQHHVAEARKVAERMVADRQSRIADVSDEILERSQALIAGIEHAERVGNQFESFVRSLSAAADRVAGLSPRRDLGIVDASPDDGGRPNEIAA